MLAYADMAELVDAPDLGSGAARCDGFESLYPHQGCPPLICVNMDL